MISAIPFSVDQLEESKSLSSVVYRLVSLTPFLAHDHWYADRWQKVTYNAKGRHEVTCFDTLRGSTT